MKVTAVPEHVGLDPDVIVVAMDGVTLVVTVIVTELEVAVVEEVHTAFEVIMHVTTLLFTSAELVKVGLFVPALAPFINH